jgi:hypothetical protein
MRRITVALLSLGMASLTCAQLAAGSWVNREIPQMTMSVVPMGSGYSITYHIVGTDGKTVTMTVQTPLDGSETPFLIDGKPTGQTYAGRRVDSRHTVGVVKMNGQTTATSKAELSADGKTITVENDIVAMAGTKASKRIEHWDKR